MTSEASADTAGRPGTRPKAASKLLVITLALVVVLSAPTIVLLFTPLAPGAGAATTAGLVASLGVLVVGVRRGLLVTVWAIIALGVSPVGLPFPALGVMFIVCLGASTGFAAYRGADLPIYMLNLMVGMTMLNPPAMSASQITDGVAVTPAYIATLTGVLALGGGWGFAVICLLRTRLPQPPHQVLQREAAMVYGATLALLTGMVAAVALTWFQYSLAGWAILTIYLVHRPVFTGADVTHGMRVKAAHRVAGTIGGVIIAAALATVIHNPSLLVLTGIAFLVVAVSRMLAKVPYWEFVLLLTPAMVFMDGNGANVDHVGLVRILCTLVGLALALGALEFNRRFTFPWIARSKELKAGGVGKLNAGSSGQ